MFLLKCLSRSTQRQSFILGSSILGSRQLSTIVPVAELRPGNFVKVKDEFCVVLNQRRIAFGRAAGYLMLEYHPYADETKIMKTRMGLTETLERIEPERINGTFSYCDLSARSVMLNDEDYNELEVPLSLFPRGFENVIQPGDPVTVFRNENTWLSCALKADMAAKLKRYQ